jgi:hypothetical protein
MQEFYTAEREREDALFFESQSYNAFREADRERHYLWRAGFTGYCDCATCDGEREAEAQAAMEAAWFDFDATEAEIDAVADDLFRRSVAEQFAAATASDPWGVAGAEDQPPF